jgi:hypothetical protein
MSADLAVLTIHGMGNTPETYADDLMERLERKLGTQLWRRIHVGKIYYQNILQQNQVRMFRDMRQNSEIDYIKLRQFLLFGFSDAAGLERKASAAGSPYERAQQAIQGTLNAAWNALGATPKPVMIFAHSLGCQVMSNYIWDSQSPSSGQGVWKDSPPTGTEKDNFLRLKSLRALYTTGCNIPIFLAGFPMDELVSFKTKSGGYDFEWHNFYDEDDVLGWPLKPMSPSFSAEVTSDHAINADGGLVGKLVSGWNPLSHNEYWKDSEVLNRAARTIQNLMP